MSVRAMRAVTLGCLLLRLCDAGKARPNKPRRKDHTDLRQVRGMGAGGCGGAVLSPIETSVSNGSCNLWWGALKTKESRLMGTDL